MIRDVDGRILLQAFFIDVISISLNRIIKGNGVLFGVCFRQYDLFTNGHALDHDVFAVFQAEGVIALTSLSQRCSVGDQFKAVAAVYLHAELERFALVAEVAGNSLGDGQFYGALLPNSVQNVLGCRVSLIDDNLIASLIELVRFRCIPIFRPSKELVTGTCRQSEFGIAIVQNRHCCIVFQLTNLLGRRCPLKVGFVGQLRLDGLVSPDGVEGNNAIVIHIHIRLNGQLVSGLVNRSGGSRFGCPAKEYLVSLSQITGQLYIRVRALGVLCVIYRGIAAGCAVFIVFDAIPLLAADMGIQFVVPIDLGIKVERRAVLQLPSKEGFSLIQLDRRNLTFIKLCAFGYRKRVDLVAVMIVERHGVGRGYPLGIDGDVLGGHFFACEVILRLSRRVGIPGVKHVVFFSDRLSRGFIFASVADVSFVLIGSCIHCLAITDVNYIIAIAGVIEVCFIIITTISRASDYITSKSCDIITIFFCNSRVG